MLEYYLLLFILLLKLTSPKKVENLDGPNINEAISSRIHTTTENKTNEPVNIDKAFNARASYIEKQRPDPSVKTNITNINNQRLNIHKNEIKMAAPEGENSPEF